MRKYNFKKIEKKWQRYWQSNRSYELDMDRAKKPFYNLMMFPYPSAEGLHVGGVYTFTGVDTFGRYKKMRGFDVFEPIGLDGFGIHSENYAMKIGEHIKDVSRRTEKNFYRQLHSIGNMYDWSRTVETYKPEYYRWTQWLFLQMYKKGLAYRKKAKVNWCPWCKTVLSDEQVIAGKCERCDSEVEKRELDQWFFAITKYADKLLKNLDWINWPEDVKQNQRNWIGKSEGAIIKFEIKRQESKFKKEKLNRKTGKPENQLEVFTTRPDTIFGATYMVVAPEHKMLKNYESSIKNHKAVKAYIEKSLAKSEQERKAEEKEKTGVEIKGVKAINPATGKEIPIWVADYVLGDYGTGAIMAVPAHDQRDWDFAKKYNLPIIEVVREKENGKIKNSKIQNCFEGEGRNINSDFLDGLETQKAKKEIIKWLEKNEYGKKAVDYKLRDWCISRQRYWGPPIPIVYCRKCGMSPVPEKDLPVKLPPMKDFLPEGKGKGPLAKNKKFIKTKCPICGGEAERETDVSDPFVDSGWYFFRYPSTDFNDRPFDKKRTKKWLPVDSYIGGKEHTVLHLLYSRFVTMVLKDLGHIDFEEPYKRFFGHGLITKDGAKMSKSKGNVVNPDEMIEKYGTDTVRLYLRFLGDFSQGGDWQDNGVAGMHKFINRVWKIFFELDECQGKGVKNDNMIDKTIKVVGADIEKLSFNTAVARIMEFVNWIKNNKKEFSSKQARNIKEKLALILAPMAPHLAEEFWESLGNKNSIFNERWPKFNKNKILEERFEMVVQINGKLRDKIMVSRDITAKEAEKEALLSNKIASYIKNKKIKKIVYVPGRLVNVVVTNCHSDRSVAKWRNLNSDPSN
jgi:leucyl-tRNA synthetase